jgi:arylsulfatase A-like enzyme
MDAKDQGVVLRYGDGPDQCDWLGAREAIVFQSGGTYYLHYDGAGPRGWLACLATSTDLVHWTKKGPILDFGKPGEPDSACACSPWVYFDGELWHMFYVATPLATPPPERIPAVPYLTCKATSRSPAGPWIKQKDLVPFRPKPGTYYADTANSGYVLKHGDEYLMFFSAAAFSSDAARVLKRTLGIARTKDLDGPWQVDPQPSFPPEEQVENSSLYFEPANQTWFLFTNHIGIDRRGEYTDAVWVYWSKDVNRWDTQCKAVVLDGRNCSWSKDCIGMPTVIPVGRRLALLYDAPGGTSVNHMRRSIGLAWLDLPLAPPGSIAAAPPRQPNIVLILADDMGFSDLGCYGSTFYETPNLDRLGREGMRFTDAYAACPVCSPTRASIMTGKYPVRLGTTDWFGAPQPDTVERHWTRNKPLLPARYLDRLPLEEITLAEALKEAGYSTFFAGKWHLGGPGYLPEDQGFDINKGGCQFGSPPGGYFSPYKNPKLPDGPKGEHLDDRLAAESVGFLKQVGNRPFLLYLSFYSVHTPLQAKKELVAKYDQKRKQVKHDGPPFKPEGQRQARQIQDHAAYAAMVETMDHAVGEVLNALQQLGLADHTAVIFMSDNGGLSTSEGSPTSNLPLRAGKGWLYEGGIREPMVVKWPGVTRPGSTCNTPVVSTDFYPTILQMAGLPLKPRQHADGISFVPLLKQTGSISREAIYWHYPHYGNQGGSPGSAIRAGDWKLIEFFEDGRLELYNLHDDLGEQHNLAKQQPDRVAQLHQMLKTWRTCVGAKLPTPNPNRAVGDLGSLSRVAITESE